MSKISIKLDDSALAFLDRITTNRSGFINELIKQEEKKQMMARLEAEYEEQSNDPEWQSEIKLWDCTASDGLDDSVEGLVNHE